MTKPFLRPFYRFNISLIGVLVLLSSQPGFAQRQTLALGIFSFSRFTRGAVIKPKNPTSPAFNEPLNPLCEYLWFQGPNLNPAPGKENANRYGMNYIAHHLSVLFSNISNKDQTIELHVLPGSNYYGIDVGSYLVNFPSSDTLARTISVPPFSDGAIAIRNACEFFTAASDSIQCGTNVVDGNLSVLKSYGSRTVTLPRHFQELMDIGMKLNLKIIVKEDLGAITARLVFNSDFRPSNYFNCVVEDKVGGAVDYPVNAGRPF